MSAGYADRLTKGVDYGTCGLPERIDNKRVLTNKITRAVELFKKSKYIVAHTGAGISTAAGIPDFVIDTYPPTNTLERP
jgi:mono-ADP-ribosyltransferase sirtuin 6